VTTLHSRTGVLRSKVFLALAGVFLVFLSARGGLLWWEHDRTLASEQRRAENLAHVLAEHLDRTFGALESAVNQLAVRSDRIGGPRAPREEWSAVLAATLSGLSGIGSLNLLDAEGFVVLSTNPAVTGTSRRGRYLHRRLKDERSNRLVIGPAAPAEHIEGVRIPIGRALHDAGGKFIGFIAATFQPERLRGFYEAIDVGPHGVIRLFHADGNLLFSQPHAARERQEAAGAAAILSTSRDGSGRGFLRAPFGAGGESYLTAWRALSGSALVVTVSVAEQDAFSAWYTELVTVSGSAGGMALLLGLAGAWIVTSGRVHAETAAERDRAGAALHRSQVQFQAIIDHSPSGIVLRDRDGRHLVANRKVQEWYGLPAEEILGKTVSELFGEEAGREEAEQDRRVAATGDVLTREVATTFPDGAVRRIATTEFPVRFADDDTVFVGGILTDVTSAREAEEKLRQSQKMEAIGQLTGGVAHDFNNMLTAIMGNLEFLRPLLGGDRAALGHLDTAVRAALRSSELTHRLLAFSRRQPMAPVSTDVNRLVADCRVLLQRTLGAEIGIETYMSENAWPALVDPSQLENALLNLAINARDAMPGGGKLTIESANMTFDDNHSARNPEVAPGPHVMISVSDTGAGIAPDALRRVFEPFYTTKPQGEGTGLGLSMVYGFAKQSGGHVSIYSELGHGTTVRLFLPRAAGASPEADAPEAPSGEILTGTETILVVEDDEDVADFVAAALESLGYTVVPASDGPSALRCLRERDRVDLLLTDVVLPNGMNGREIAEKVREIVPDIRTVFMSGYAESIIVHQGRLEEGLDFLPKPFARDALARKVRASLDSRPARPAS
jgi:PAS domain S-box-containing protein